MLLKNKIFKWISYPIVSLFALYCLVCSIRNLTHALAQPHLESNGVVFNFTGYYIQSIVYGTVFLVVIMILILLIVLSLPHKNKER